MSSVLNIVLYTLKHVCQWRKIFVSVRSLNSWPNNVGGFLDYVFILKWIKHLLRFLWLHDRAEERREGIGCEAGWAPYH